MEKPFFGKTALITGSSRGVGRAIACRLASQGANILLHYRRNKEEAEKVEDEISVLGAGVKKYAADLSDLEEVKQFLTHVKEENSSIDIFVANAAATAFKPLLQIREHHIEKTMNITISNFILAIAQLKPLMPPGSKVITISGIDTQKYCANHGLLAAAKSALETLTRYYAVELKSDPIYFHGLNPGIVETDSMRFYLKEKFETAKNEIVSEISQGKLTPPEDIAEMVSFLCTPAANWMNGQTLLADGGLSFKMPGFSNLL